MDKKRNIKIVVGIVVLLAILLQATRFDNFIVSNFQNPSKEVDMTLINNDKVVEHYPNDDRFLIVYDSSEEMSDGVYKNIERIMKQLKKQYRVEDVSSAKEIYITEKTVLIMLEDLGKIKNLKSMIAYVEDGGRLAFLETPDQNNNFDSMRSPLGIIDAGDTLVTDGIAFDEKFMPAYGADYLENNALRNFSIPVTLENDCEVYMTSKADIPLLWTHDFKEGRLLFFNGTMYEDKMMTGFLTRCLALLNENFIYPVINSKVIWLDDFPAPMTNGYYDEIKSTYNKTIKEFYIDVWWPEMLEISKEYDLKYTGVMIQTYNDRTSGPFLPAQGEISDSEFIALGRELIRSGGELGLHGYNHQSLTREYWKSDELGYNKWANKGDMKHALKAVREKIKRTFPNYEINVYVPPSNVIGEEGISALKDVFPEIDVIASVYYEDYEHLSYSQEFDYSDQNVLNLPRFSSGYNFGMGNRLSVLNGILGFGAIQHFIHPDDFMDPERNEGKSWREQVESFEAFAEIVDRRYPFIEAQTASEAAVNVEKYIGLDYTVDYSDSGIQVKTNAKVFPMYMFLRSSKEIQSSKNCEVHAFGKEDYFVMFTDSVFSIDYKR
ncbi:DUF2194 domain-containing protein [Fusibacter ferrireducens]|uniref:DUF2194 domain-containing protein n=1 Tax=Fusibacter ferrireducens TaxID=2785058 RepID=A0ABR9ZUR5_9FIRM|nr:DUF2194 domain-containing protein [Fusibacter ferrireducens]MBF4694202.1 DUF2194 domain-containing protein [Fusibacter ferrireducens]